MRKTAGLGDSPRWLVRCAAGLSYFLAVACFAVAVHRAFLGCGGVGDLLLLGLCCAVGWEVDALRLRLDEAERELPCRRQHAQQGRNPGEEAEQGGDGDGLRGVHDLDEPTPGPVSSAPMPNLPHV